MPISLKRYSLARKSVLMRRWGILPDEYERVLESQNRKCAICKTDQSELDRALAVDHDHQTGMRRGLLCTECNLSVGRLRDDPAFALAIHKYLTIWNERKR